MNYLYIIFGSGILGVLYQIYTIVKIKNKIEQADREIGAYKYKDSKDNFFMQLIPSLILLLIPIFRGEGVYVFWVSPIWFIAFLVGYKKAKKIELYDTGLIVLGDFIEWEKIGKVERNDNEIKLITNDRDPKHYTISKLEEAKECYENMQKLASLV